MIKWQVQRNHELSPSSFGCSVSRVNPSLPPVHGEPTCQPNLLHVGWYAFRLALKLAAPPAHTHTHTDKVHMYVHNVPAGRRPLNGHTLPPRSRFTNCRVFRNHTCRLGARAGISSLFFSLSPPPTCLQQEGPGQTVARWGLFCFS
jgi:hypothetical protein